MRTKMTVNDSRLSGSENVSAIFVSNEIHKCLNQMFVRRQTLQLGVFFIFSRADRNTRKERITRPRITAGKVKDNVGFYVTSVWRSTRQTYSHSIVTPWSSRGQDLVCLADLFRTLKKKRAGVKTRFVYSNSCDERWLWTKQIWYSGWENIPSIYVLIVGNNCVD